MTQVFQWVPRENNSARVYVRLPTDPDTIAADQTQKSASRDSREKIMQVSSSSYGCQVSVSKLLLTRRADN